MTLKSKGATTSGTCSVNQDVTRSTSMPATVAPASWAAPPPCPTGGSAAVPDGRVRPPWGRAARLLGNRTPPALTWISMPIDVTDETFETDVIERSKTVPVVVDLWAEWCGPCKTLGPIIEKVVDGTGGKVELAKVDVDNNPGISQAFRVQSIPAVFALKDGKVVDGFIGAQPETAVQKFV